MKKILAKTGKILEKTAKVIFLGYVLLFIFAFTQKILFTNTRRIKTEHLTEELGGGLYLVNKEVEVRSWRRLWWKMSKRDVNYEVEPISPIEERRVNVSDYLSREMGWDGECYKRIIWISPNRNSQQLPVIETFHY